MASGGKEGLDKKEAIAFVEETANSGNEKIFISGKDGNGAEISGNNEKFKVTAGIDVAGLDTKQKAALARQKLNELVEHGIIKSADFSEETAAKIFSVLNEVSQDLTKDA